MGYIPSLDKRIDAQRIEPNTPIDLAIWLFFQISTAHVLLPVLLATFLFTRSIARHPTLINVCITWIIGGIISSLLLYTGEHIGPEPAKSLCITQMALIYSVPPMCSTAVLALVYHTWSMFRPSNSRTGQRIPTNRLVTCFLISAPYVVFVSFAAAGVRLGTQRPDQVTRSRRFFYCSTAVEPYNIAVPTFTSVVCVLAAVLEVHLVATISRNWTTFRRASLIGGVDLQLIVRVVVFTAYILLAAVSTLSTVAGIESVLPDMFSASVGMMFFVTFASQPGVLHVWSRILLCGRTTRRPKPYKYLASRSSTPAVPFFDCDPFEHTNRDKARLDALHAYYEARVHDMGLNVEVIRRPEDAFFEGRLPKRVWDDEGNWGLHWM